MSKSLFYLALNISLLIDATRAHGYLASPRSRNFVAREDGINRNKPGVPGIPYVEYCHTCLTRNAGVCGLSIHDHNYDDWLDSAGSPMPWVSQATYKQGSIVQINSFIKAHHYGHIEVSACPEGRLSTQECFDQHRLTFVRDLSHGMPFDPKHPERGYLALGDEFVMEFKLPDGVSGDSVLLQWRYVTANSCNPVDYPGYFAGANDKNEVLPAAYWNSKLNVCYYPLPLDGSRGFRKPEQFFNCAEITILPSSTESLAAASPALSPVTQEKTANLADSLAMQETISTTISQITQEATSTSVSQITQETASPTISPVTQDTTIPTMSPVAQETATTSPTTLSPVTPETATSSPTTISPVAPETATTSPTTTVPAIQETTSPIFSEATISTDPSVNTVSSENDLIAAELCCPEGYTGMQFTMGCTHYFSCTEGLIDSDVKPCPLGSSLDGSDQFCDSSDIFSCEYVPCTISEEDAINDVQADTSDVEEDVEAEADTAVPLVEGVQDSLDLPLLEEVDSSGMGSQQHSLFICSLVLFVQVLW